MKNSLPKKIIIITGTRKGLGKELSMHYLNNGNTVIGCSRGESSIVHEDYEHFSVDVSDEKSVVAMVRNVHKKYGRIDALINNAGIASMNHLTLSPGTTAKKIFDTNFMGTFIFVREVSKVMLQKRYGRIVNFATVATPLRLEGEALYAASKAAVVNFTEVAAKELGHFGITVNAIGPTPIPTDLIKTLPKEKIDALVNQQAIKRIGNYNDVLNVVDFFMDDRSDFITGQVIYLGGITH
jgi:3-oxoacyl-[acyl-carrier protein] reductase